jgi:hypothetical protein
MPVMVKSLLAMALLVPTIVLEVPMAQAAVPTVTKTAQVVGGPAGEGTAQNPIPVKIGDTINYTIRVNNPNKVTYDFLFVLDYSESMLAGYEDDEYSGGVENSFAAIARGKKTIFKATDKIFANYPGSRIAYMGMNANYPHSNDPRNTYVQVNTNFLDSGSITSLKNAYASSPSFRFDNPGIFINAAKVKFYGKDNGETTASFGGAEAALPGGKAVPTVTVRKRTDTTRIPVLIIVSDFQVGMGKVPDIPGGGGNFARLITEAGKFITTKDGNILLAARADSLDSRNKKIYGTPEHDAKMDTLFKDRGGMSDGKPRWGWVKYTKGMNQDTMDNKLIDLIQEKVPQSSTATISDKLPAGLEYVSSDRNGKMTRDENGVETVTWDLASLKEGSDNVFTVTAKVKDYGTFVNDAQVKITGENEAVSNKTYHEATAPSAAKKMLHVRQMVLERGNSTIELPQLGYLQLGNGGVDTGITALSGVHADNEVDFQDYELTIAETDKIVKAHTIVPQYYEYQGYVATDTKTSHNPAGRNSGEVSLDYSAKDEYWVTVYISPAKTAPGNHTWSTYTNDFGKIGSAP